MSTWVLIALIETAHGILRAKLLAPKVGDLRSRQIATFSGCGLIYLMTWIFLPWIAPSTAFEAIGVGVLWTSCMLVFEFALGRYVFHFSWKWLLNDFNFFKGRLLLFGMIFLAFAPYLVGRQKGLFQ